MEFSTIKQFARKNNEEDRWPASESAIRALRHKMNKNGFKHAFKNFGKRVLINEVEFWKAVDKFISNK